MTDFSEATRQLGQFSDLYPFMYTMAAVASMVCILGIVLRVRKWQKGRGFIKDRLNNPGIRLLKATGEILTQARVLGKKFPGALHFLIFWGFVVFFVGTVSLMLQERFGLRVYTGPYYLFLNMAMDLMAVLGLGAVILAMARRLLSRERSLRTEPGDLIVLVLVAFILITGVLLEAVRITVNGDPWASWQPAGYILSNIFRNVEPTSMATLWPGLWIFHMLLSLAFIASIPYWKMFHILAAFPALFFGDRYAARALPTVDLENENLVLGAENIYDLSWKQLLDADSCMACGRCDENCPANMVGKNLSPLDINLGVRKGLRGGPRSAGADKRTNHGKLVPEKVGKEALWACTTCRACETSCPVLVEHVPRLVEIRRNEVMMKGDFPTELVVAFRGMEDNYNPWNISWSTRHDWAAEMDVPILKNTGTTPLLLWTGCFGAFDNRNQKVLRSLVWILRKAGMEFATLGTEEKCCGDPARRLGHELLFQTLAMDNIETLDRYKVSKIVTTCPHCYNSLSNDYTLFGGRYEVIHHTDLINSFINEGYITPSIMELDNQNTWAYHDPCYLGRYNEIYETPRKALIRSVGSDIREFSRSRIDSTCCGGGGGRMWLEEEKGKATANIKVEEVLATGIDAVATACPYCLTMLSDGLKEIEDIKVMDVAEVVASAIGQNSETR